MHLDIKKLARIVRPGHRISGNRRDTVRGAGWQFAHMAIDDHSRLGYGEMLPDDLLVRYLNRLSDYLFVLARSESDGVNAYSRPTPTFAPKSLSRREVPTAGIAPAVKKLELARV